MRNQVFADNPRGQAAQGYLLGDIRNGTPCVAGRLGGLLGEICSGEHCVSERWIASVAHRYGRGELIGGKTNYHGCSRLSHLLCRGLARGVFSKVALPPAREGIY